VTHVNCPCVVNNRVQVIIMGTFILFALKLNSSLKQNLIILFAEGAFIGVKEEAGDSHYKDFREEPKLRRLLHLHVLFLAHVAVKARDNFRLEEILNDVLERPFLLLLAENARALLLIQRKLKNERVLELVFALFAALTLQTISELELK